MGNKNVKIAVVGSGYWGKNLVRVFYELGVLKTICDNSSDILKDMNEKYTDISVTTDYSEILNEKEIAGIVISLPAEKHYEYARKAILAGKHVFIEKPIALNNLEAEEIVKIAKEYKKILMVGHILHYHPSIIRLKEMLRNGDFGKIQYIYSNRLNLGKIRREENILWSFAPHDISMILTLVDKEPISIYTSGGYYLHEKIADTTMTLIDFPDGVKAHIFVSWLHPFKQQELVVIGDKSMAVFDDTKSWNEKLLLYPYKIFMKNGISISEKKEPEKIIVEESEPLKNECLHFLDCIVNNKIPISDGKEGAGVVKVLEAAQKSLDTKMKINLKG